ncbi:hypothetical protein PPROV_000682500 [Pycnococcus provasolii]|uniref:RNA helicase n=1 Tax=Pycnococcus provasolii TaxID=41880 RepID=A0A830HN19_9CHLO|nr:hypothetical protein PPROV_000682500 [Pycnococcus provasolii]
MSKSSKLEKKEKSLKKEKKEKKLKKDKKEKKDKSKKESSSKSQKRSFDDAATNKESSSAPGVNKKARTAPLDIQDAYNAPTGVLPVVGAPATALPKLKKNLLAYTSSFLSKTDAAAATSASQPSIADVLAMREPHDIAVEMPGESESNATPDSSAPSPSPPPTVTFEQAAALLAPPYLKSSVATFEKPSAIQAQAWPLAFRGYDMVGIAKTGSGKTLAFALPAIAHVVSCRAREESGEVPKPASPLKFLALAPTRELCTQIAGVVDGVAQAAGVHSIAVFGGVPKYPQIEALTKDKLCCCCIATPGRVEDICFNDVRIPLLAGVSFLVLDEADRMLDLGFEPSMRRIISQIRADRQTLMFSATWPPEVEKLAHEFLGQPVTVRIGKGGRELTANHAVTQKVHVIEERDKERMLTQILREELGDRGKKGHAKAIIFALYKKEAVRLEQFLQRGGYNCASVHGDKSQRERFDAVESFKNNQVRILVATDVASRGLDIPDVELVINNTFPLTTEDYVHRIGRTGRAGKTGRSITLFGSVDKPRAGELINVLREAKQDVPEELLKFGTTVKKKESKLYGAHFKDIDMTKKATKITFD